jgi:hypothetical protein
MTMPKYDLLRDGVVIASSAAPWVYSPEEGGIWRSGGMAFRGEEGLSNPSFRTLMTPIRFKAQFSVGEQVAIKRARAYAGEDDEAKAYTRDALDILFGSLDDPRLAEVDVADPSVIGGIDFCHSIGILTADRAATIKLGVVQPTP